ncbi:LamG-like jellyroll fold domain-containing protein [Saccharomonospora xinjiangensis]|uniref:LamG-like jellyroll fold domain-containing protein n=1 Tax=Saccharomonospora xinjiangensis TaxID=75294 RepID=UPI001FFC7304|nr:LamG-like jellyroll fold domain-containing protein [Saccharomonospora xinjiangensis]
MLTLLLVVVVTAGLIVALPWGNGVGLAEGEIPEQEWGTAAGRSHSVSAESTAATVEVGKHTSKPADGLGPDQHHPGAALVEPPVRETTVDVREADDPPAPQGFDPATSRLLVDESKPDLQVFANADGTRTLRAYEGPQFYRTTSGWEKIDTTLVEDGDGWRTRADSDVKRFTASADRSGLATVDLGEYSFAFGVADAESVRGEVDGSAIVYPELRPESDLKVEATPVGVKEAIVLKSPDAPTTWDFPLRLEGLSAELSDGAVVLRDADGTVRGVIPPGFMEDSNLDPRIGEGARSRNVSYELLDGTDGPVLRVRADEEWLADPERAFPVVIDPTVSKDSNGSTYVMSGYEADYSGDPLLSVGTFNGGGNVAAAYLKFDSISSQLAGHYVLGAELHLYSAWSYSCEARNVTVHPVTQAWSVSGKKTYPGPSYGASIAEKSFAYGHSSGCSSRWVTIGLGEQGRDLLHGWTHGKPNHGLTVRASTTDSKGWKKFASVASANAPYLEVTSTPYWATYQVGDLISPVSTTDDGIMRVTVTNHGKDTWTPTNGYELGYRIWDASGNELPYDQWAAWTKMPRNVAPGQSVTVDARIKALPPGTYSIHWDMGLRGETRFSWNDVPMSQRVVLRIPNQTPMIESAFPPSNFNAATLTPTLAMKGRDRDTHPGKPLQYNFKICAASGEDCTESGWRSTPRWTVPEGTLQWSKDYVWHGQISDTKDATPWTLPSYLSTRVPQPSITSHLASTEGVDPGVGNYSTQVTDATVSVPGPDLSVIRTYNSLDPRQGLAFGSGWATRWDTRVRSEDDTDTVLVTYPDGRQARFGKNPDGNYAAPPGQGLSLVAVEDGWLLRFKNGDRYSFDTDGRLVSITDAVGHVQGLTYRADGTLERATDAASGRALHFTWTDGHVVEVRTGPDPELSWNYSYAGDRLTAVCDPTDACTTYAYDNGSHYPTVVRDANPHAYWRLTETEGTTATSEVPGFWGSLDGTATGVTLGQERGPLAGSPATAAVFDGSTSYVELPDDLVRNSAYASVELWFKTTSTTGGVLFSTSHDEPGDAAPSGSMPVLYVGTDGRLHGHFWNNQAEGMASPGAVNDGRWHHVVLTGAFDTQTLYLDGTAIDTLSGELANLDPHNFLGVGAVNDRAWPSEPPGPWSYFDGAIAEAAFYQHPLDPVVVAEHYAARVVSDRLTSVTRPGGAVEAELTYDEIADRITTYVDGNGGTRTYGKPTVEGDGFRYASAVRESTPGSYWRMSEAEGVEAHSNPDLRRGVYHRGGGGRVDGPFPGGSARMFDGTESYVRLPDDTLHGARRLSLELWFKTTSADGGVLFSIADHKPGEPSSNGSMPVLYVGTDGKLHGHFWQGTVAGISSQTTVNDGDWHHVVLTGSIDTQTLYLDGTKVGSLSGTISNHRVHTFVGTGWTPNHSWPAIGSRDWAYFDGSIAQVAVYHHALSAERVAAHHTARTDRAAYVDAVRTTAPHTRWGLEDGDTARHAEPDGTTTLGSYHDVSLGAEPVMRGAHAVGFDGTAGHVRLPDNEIHGRQRLAVELWFKTTSADGGVLFSIADHRPGEPSSNGSMPVLYVGTDGKLHGHFWNNSVKGIVSAEAVNDGEWHHAVLSADRTRQWLYLDGNLVDHLDGEILNYRTHAFVGTGWTANLPWPNIGERDWAYFDGSIGEAAVYQRPLDSASIAAHYSARTASTEVRTTDPAGQETVYTYDPTRGGRVMSVTLQGAGTTLYEYDKGGFVRRIVDENGHAVTYVNDERGNRLSTTRCRDESSEACYTSYREYFVNPDDPLDPRNDSVTFARDARSTSNSDDRYATRYVLHGNGLVSSVLQPGATGGLQRTTSHTYTDGSESAVGGGTQPAWLLETTTDPAGNVTRYAYTSAGDLARVTDPAGMVTEYAHDGLGRVISETVNSAALPEGSATTTYRYDGVSRLVEQTDPAATNAVTGVEHQQRTTNVYNPDGTLASTTVSDVAGHDAARTTSYTYDQHGRVHTVTDPEGGMTTTEHDDFGAVVRTVNPVGTEFLTTYTKARHQLATRTVKGFTGDGQPARDVVLESRAYDPAGRLASVTDAMGRTTAYTYYDDDLLASETLLDYTDPSTGETRDVELSTYTYTGTGQIDTHTYGEGRFSTTTTTYDNADRPVLRTDREGDDVLRQEETSYDDTDNVTRVVGRDADGSVHSDVEFTHDELGRETGRTVHTGSESLLTLIHRDEAGLVRSVVDPRGTATGADPEAFTTRFTYDALGRQITQVAPPVEAESHGNPAVTATPVTTVGYNAFGEETELKDPRGNVTHTSYDRAGRPAEVRRPDYLPPGANEPITATTSLDHDAAGRVVASTDELGHTTTYGYDELGNQRRVTDPPALHGQAGGTWLATYDPLGEVLSTSDPRGTQTHATYDKLGRQITSTVVETVPEPTRILTTRYTHDELGNVATVTSPAGRVVETTYDDLGNELTVTDGLGNTTTNAYDGAGRLVSSTDATGRGSEIDYDRAGRQLSVSDFGPDGTVERTREFAYDRTGNPTRVTNALGAATTYTYDALNRLTSITRPVSDSESITTSYGYDRAGNITRATDGNGNATVFTVNAWNMAESTIEPATEQTPEVADRTYTAVYDAAGRLAELRKPGGVTITHSYDPQGNLVKQVGSGASVVTPDRVFTYDPAGRMVSASAPNGDNTFAYDDRGNLVTASGPSGESSFTYDADGLPTSVTTSAGMSSFSYDAAGRLATALDAATGATLGYDYDEAGRVTSVGYGVGAATRGYGYDNLGRIASDTVTAPDGTETASITYEWDDEDHLVAKHTEGVAGAAQHAYGYDRAGRLVSWDDGIAVHTYEWDAAGNLTRDGPVSAVFNERNQLLSKAGVEYSYTPRGTLASRTAGGVSALVEFNAFDELVADGGTDYRYDALNRLVSAGGSALSYVGSGIKVASDGQGEYSYTPGGLPLGVAQGGVSALAWSDVHTDLIGLVDPGTGVLAGSRSYSPFGQRQAGVGTQPALGFQHQYTDPDSGNVNMGARWYQPGTATFASRDTAGLDPRDVGNSNRYAYASADPLGRIDPSGYISLDWLWDGLDWVGEGIKEISGYNDVVSCLGGSWSGCGWAVAGLTPWGKAAKLIKGGKAAAKAGKAPSPSVKAPKTVLTGPQAKRFFDQVGQHWRNFTKNLKAAVKRAFSLCGGRCGVAVARAVSGALGKGGVRAGSRAEAHAAAAAIAAARSSDAAAAAAAAAAARAARVRRDVLTPHKRPEPTRTLSPEIRKRLDAVQNSAPIDVGVVLPESSADDFADAITTHVPISAPRGGPSPRAGRADVEWSASCTSNSFVPGTKVVMADGSAKPIEEVELGDRVLATDPETGKTVSRKVTATITGEGQKRLVEVTVDIDGAAGEATETITATDGHPFWVADLEEWVPAGELQPGDWLRTGSGSWVQVQSIKIRTEAQRVHNLTVDDLHTYHVLAGATPVLVHNCGPGVATEDDAMLALNRAEGLQASRNDYYMADVKGTTAVIGVFNSQSKKFITRIGINGNGVMPSNWKLRPGEEFVRGPGHAEEGVLNSLGPNEHAVFGAASRNFCIDTCLPMINVRGITVGGVGIRGHTARNSPYAIFWATGD